MLSNEFKRVDLGFKAWKKGVQVRLVYDRIISIYTYRKKAPGTDTDEIYLKVEPGLAESIHFGNQELYDR